jgi:hypothetical protein
LTQSDRLWEKAFFAQILSSEKERKEEQAQKKQTKSKAKKKEATCDLASIRTLQDLGYPFASWKEACIACVRFNGDKPVVSVAASSVRQLYTSLEPELRRIAGTDNQFTCSGEMDGNPKLYIPKLDTILSLPCKPAELQSVVAAFTQQPALTRSIEVRILSLIRWMYRDLYYIYVKQCIYIYMRSHSRKAPLNHLFAS